MSLRCKEDIRVTRNLREAKVITHPDSKVGLDGHLYFEGEDKARLRPLVFRRHKNRCVVCGARLSAEAEDWTPMRGDWHHPAKCDCVECSELRCGNTNSSGRKCHAHRTEGFKRRVA